MLSYDLLPFFQDFRLKEYMNFSPYKWILYTCTFGRFNLIDFITLKIFSKQRNFQIIVKFSPHTLVN